MMWSRMSFGMVGKLLTLHDRKSVGAWLGPHSFWTKEQRLKPMDHIV